MTDSLTGRWTAALSRLTGWRRAGLAAGFGALAGLGQAPFSLEVAALAGLSGGLLMHLAAQTPRRAVTAGWAFGTGYFALALFWIVEPFLVDIPRHGWMAPFALVFLAGGLALFWAAAAALAHWLGGGPVRRALGWALALGLAEMARGYVLTGFPWALIGYVWTDAAALQWVAIIGPYGLTFATLLIVAAFWSGLAQGRAPVALLGLVLGAVLVGGGSLLTPPQSDLADRPVLRLIQPNAAQHLKWDPDWMQIFYDRQITYSAAPPGGAAPAQVIWPETAIPWRLDRADAALGAIAARSVAPVILGVQRRAEGRAHNALVTLDRSGAVTQLYDKVRLVPFGEYIPFGQLARLVGLRSFAARDGYGYAPGPGVALIDTAAGRALPLICYEAIFPQHPRGAPERPDYILQVTNDAWFGQVSGPYQHLAQARARAIEQGLPLVRVANTGISAVIDPAGRVLQSLPLGTEGYLDARLPPPGAPTIYGRTGDAPVLLLLLIGVAYLALRRPQPK